MTKKAKTFFIISTVFTVLAVIAAIFFTASATNALTTELSQNPETDNLGSALGLIFVILVLIVYWVIVSAVLGILSIVFSSLSIKFTKKSEIVAAEIERLANGDDYLEDGAEKTVKKRNVLRILSVAELIVSIICAFSPFIFLMITNIING